MEGKASRLRCSVTGSPSAGWVLAEGYLPPHLKEIDLRLGDLTDAERQIILDGCLINYYKATM